jgi:hypothetical protein
MAIVADLSGNSPFGIDPHLNDNPNALRAIVASTIILALGAAAVNSVAFDATAGIVEIVGKGDMHIAIGPNIIATANDPLIPANVVIYRDVSFNDRVSVIQDAASTGNVYITRMNKA